ncbi:hypothetical protein CBL_10383 [Carabus blaptoides fortunei]
MFRAVSYFKQFLLSRAGDRGLQGEGIIKKKWQKGFSNMELSIKYLPTVATRKCLGAKTNKPYSLRLVLRTGARSFNTSPCVLSVRMSRQEGSQTPMSPYISLAPKQTQ